MCCAYVSYVSVQFDPDEMWHGAKLGNDILEMFAATVCGCVLQHLSALISLFPVQLIEICPTDSFRTCVTCPKGGVYLSVNLKEIFPPAPCWIHMLCSGFKQPQMMWTSTLTMINLPGGVLKCPHLSQLLRGRRLLWSWVMFIHSKVAGCIKMSHAQHECNQARLETAPLTLSLYLGFLCQQSLTSDPCPPPPSLSLSFKSFNLGYAVTPLFYKEVGVHVCTPAPWN